MVSSISSIGAFLGQDDKDKKATDITGALFAEMLAKSEKQSLAESFADDDGKTDKVAPAVPAAPGFTGTAATPDAKYATLAYKNGSETVKEFLDFAYKTPAEKWKDMILGEKGLTEEEFNALPPAERQKIEAEIAQRIKDALKTAAKDPENGAAAPAV